MHHLRRIHSVRSILTIGIPCRKRAFAVSTCLSNANSDRGPDLDLLKSLIKTIQLPTGSVHINPDPHDQAGTWKRRKKNKHPRKKKAEGKAKEKLGNADAERATVELARSSLEKFDKKRADVLQRLLERPSPLTEGVWSTGWGEDALQPPENVDHEGSPGDDGRESLNEPVQRGPPPHMPRHPLAYTRRVEGLFDDVRDPNAPSSSKSCSVNNVLEDVDPPTEHKPIAQLAHGLDRVLFNPGVYWLQDPRSRVYNFTPWLETIPKVNDFAFERVTGFIRSSQDNDLHTLAKLHSRPYVGSTSSLTGLLSHIYFLISDGKDVDTSVLSRAFAREPTNFTPGQRMPTSVVLRYNDGVWAVDSGKDGEDESDKNLLTWMGTLLEKFLTLPESEFKTLLRSAPAPPEEDNRREAYRYAKSARFLMRSQLDCVDSRLPGSGVFDVKTRAATPIRMDLMNFEENSGYLIRTLHGPLESFEKEYYDLIRSAFLKYSFQARIGNMDGVFVAYHNTARVFGFQYVSLEEMDARLFGPDVKDTGSPNGVGAPTRGARIFEKCVKLLERVMDEVVSVFGERSVKCTFETREHASKMKIWVEPLEWDAEEEGKTSKVVEMKEEEDTKNAEEVENIEAEENGVKKQEPPIVQIEVEVQNFIGGEPVRASRAIGALPQESWMLHWSISHSSLETSAIRAGLAGAKERQFRAWNFPANVSGPEEMEAWWNALDFGAPKGAALPLTDAVDGINDSYVAADGEDGLVEEEGPGLSEDRIQLPFNPRRFRRPSTSIELLRQLSRDGREETLRAEAEEEAMGREKIIWGIVGNDGLNNMAPINEPTKQLTDDSSSTSAISQASETETVDAVEKKNEEKDKE